MNVHQPAIECPILSYSLINDFRNCPHKAYHVRVLKDIPFVPTPQLEHGNRVHAAMEERVAREVKLPPDLHYLEEIAQAFHQYGAQCEVRMGVDANGKSVGWNGRGVYFRGKVDVILTEMDNPVAAIFDYKTGNKWEDPLELYTGAYLLKACYPHVTQVNVSYLWTKQLHDIMGREYQVTDFQIVGIMIADYAVKIRQLIDGGKEWPKTPNKLCSYCPVKTCEHNTSKNSEA